MFPAYRPNFAEVSRTTRKVRQARLTVSSQQLKGLPADIRTRGILKRDLKVFPVRLTNTNGPHRKLSFILLRN
jgi:hypothetical protein